MNSLFELKTEEAINLVKEFNNSFDKVDKAIHSMIEEYSKMNKNVWDSQEKDQLDKILFDYFEKLSLYASNSKQTVMTLENYLNSYKELHGIIRESIGGGDV